MPVYDMPAKPAIIDQRKATLERWKHEDEELFKAIQGQALAYKAILDTHNKMAREANKKKLEMLGFDEKSAAESFKKTGGDK